jgi:hypothetical protein
VQTLYISEANRIGAVMVSVLASSVVDRGFEHSSGLTKDHNIGICCFSVKHAALRRKTKDWFAQNQDSECV